MEVGLVFRWKSQRFSLKEGLNTSARADSRHESPRITRFYPLIDYSDILEGLLKLIQEHEQRYAD